MLFMNYLLYFILFYEINGLPQINLDLTHWISNIESNSSLQHDCLHVAAWIENEESDPYEIISYCMSEWPSQWNIKNNNQDQYFTFAQLYQLNITSEQLHLWSTPLDIIEYYELYLNHRLISNTSVVMAINGFYNCTPPRFGPLCEYSLDIHQSDHLTLNEIIHKYYLHEYQPTTLTCYIHVECDRGSISLCLDWSEICDGIVDCRNGIDEESCWQLNINQCEDNEYRCRNGQCIQKTLFKDDYNAFECLDQSDEELPLPRTRINMSSEPTFSKEDVTCSNRNMQFRIKMTSSCDIERTDLIEKLMFTDKPQNISNDCWLALHCHWNTKKLPDLICDNISVNGTLTDIIDETCPDMLYMPSSPVLFGHIYFLYTKEDMLEPNPREVVPPPQYLCYNDQLCSGFYLNRTLLTFNNVTCRQPEDFPVEFPFTGANRGAWNSRYALRSFKHLLRCNTVNYNEPLNCNTLNMYKCVNSSKCISMNLLCNEIDDCDHKDDEQCSSIDHLCLNFGLYNLKRCTARGRCISSTLVNDGFCDCGYNKYGLCDDEDSDDDYIRKHISFPTICDGFTELIPVEIDQRNETDETECEQWICNNSYTRCDGFWNCLNGADEVDCDPSPAIACSRYHHICVSPKTSQLMCLPLEQANDGNIDCLGATDEPQLCRSDDYSGNNVNIYCRNDEKSNCTSYESICDGPVCNETNYDFCEKKRNYSPSVLIDSNKLHTIGFDSDKFFRQRKIDGEKLQVKNFSLDRINNSIKQNTTMIRLPLPITQEIIRQQQQRCHRGLLLRVWLDYEKNLTSETCLCPPSFYGSMCQYQNQRISLTLRFQTYADSRQILFAIVVLLIDDSDDRLIYSHHQFSYLYVRDCKIKFNMYLLYLTRPKDEKKNYFIHIDIYEKISLAYQRSFLIPIQFSFLPVYRLAVQLNIPRTTDTIESCVNQHCIHGQCMKYSDHRNGATFCRCNPGWSGRYCNISHRCTCSHGSLCIGILPNNRSLCVCPFNKWGSQCLFQSRICNSNQNLTCLNGGKCIPSDEHVVSNKKFKCICQKGFSGLRCEIIDNEINLSFHKNIKLSQSILVHFIEVFNDSPPINGSTYQMIPVNKRTAILYWSYPFHIVFTELDDKKYYLIHVQNTYHRSRRINKEIQSKDRCPHINEINQTLIEYHLLRRIKYYHSLCNMSSSQLSCFYDDNYFCLCNYFGQQRIANCFEFQPKKKFDCFGQSNCQNEAQCLQDRSLCPQASICVCPRCFYGTLCQFSAQGFGLSLDDILGYQIQPHITITYQPFAIQFSIILTMIITIIGLINSILSFMTINNKEICQIGCGIYLLTISMITLFTMILFVLKFWILLIAQMTYITNDSFLKIQCISIDFLLRIGINMDRWLSACIAIERVIAVIKGTSFDKNKSKKMAKLIILIVFIFNISTNIHDPIHRHLIEDNENEKRIWCIITYSSTLRTYNTIMNLCHFFIPFIINLISGPLIILVTTRQRKIIRNQESYQKILKKQIQEHRHLLISSTSLIILAIPHLIIAFVSDCMSSRNDPWLFLTGYFISFIPSILTFPVFIMPSTSYKQHFLKTYERYKRTIRRRLHLVS